MFFPNSNITQRLNVENSIFAYFTGLVEEDGWFSFSKNGKYIIFEMGIELNIRDYDMLLKIQQLLKGIGNIKTYKKKTKVRFNIRNKKDLREKILLIFDTYPMISDKNQQYIKFKSVLLSNCLYYEQTECYFTSEKFKQMFNKFVQDNNFRIKQIQQRKYTYYFSHWLVGFVEAEGCFSIYKIKKPKDYYVASFEVSQTSAKFLIVAIKNFLNLKTELSEHVFIKNNKKSINYRLKVSSVSCIENVVTFFENQNTSFLGYKKEQYNKWVNDLINIPRYKHIRKLLKRTNND
jgi:hypothetical protein